VGQNAKYSERADNFRFAPMNGHHQARTPCRKSAPIADILAAGNHYTGGATKGSLAIGWCPPGIQRRGHPELESQWWNSIWAISKPRLPRLLLVCRAIAVKNECIRFSSDFQVICVCAVRRFLLRADFVAKGIAAKPARARYAA
jgi:hypothetical protein